MNRLLDRHGFFALLIAQVAIVLLHLQQLPWLLWAVALCVLVWRVQIYRYQWSFPNRWLKIILVFIALTIVIVSYRQWYTLEPMLILLLLTFLLKLLEAKTQRDAWVVVCVAYFLNASVFLFGQGIIITMSGVLVLCVLTACLLVLHTHLPVSQSGTQISRKDALFTLIKNTLKKSSLLLLQSLPLMLLLFFIFPRLGPLWSVPLQSSSAYTGVSDSMSPGDFSQLSRSRELAFRVRFDESKLPPPERRYWRGLVLNDFDGRRWSRSRTIKQQQLFPLINEDLTTGSVSEQGNSQKDSFSYEIVLESTGQRWLYGIPLASIIDQSVSRTLHNELLLTTPIAQRMQYHVQSRSQVQAQEHNTVLQQALQLPDAFNEKTLSQAKVWWREKPEPQAYIQRVLAFYQQSFYYTLSPPELGKHSIDEFLFETQRGFCEHYASSFVVLMRAVGIPARVVVGYQGGEWNEEDQYLIVRQLDAHAWAEVWLQGQGWLRVDPTAAVAPNRIEVGLQDSLNEQEQALIDRLPLGHFAWVNRLALEWDSINYRWQRWVLSYDEQTQANVLRQWLGAWLSVCEEGDCPSWFIILLLFFPFLFVLLAIAFWVLKRPRTRHSPTVNLYFVFCRYLAHRGVRVRQGDTLRYLCQQGVQQLPDKAALLERIEQLFVDLLYLDTDQDMNAGQKNKQKQKQLKRLLYFLRKKNA